MKGRKGALAVVSLAVITVAAAGCESPRSDSAVPEPTAATSTIASPTSSATPAPRPAPRRTATTTSRPKASAKPSAKPAAKPAPKPMLARGDRGEKVRELQHRLKQLDWYDAAINGRYGGATVRGVSGFQRKRDLPATGAVDTKTWAKLTAMTRTPSYAERHNQLVPGPAIWSRGDSGEKVRELQARLKQIGWFSGEVTGFYGDATVSGVRGFQAKREIPVTGDVDQRTWDRLTGMTRAPSKNEKHNVAPKPAASGLDSRCLTGRSMCISKRTNSLVWVVDGKPKLRVDVRFGAYETPTREGSFSVQRKAEHWVSTIYHTPMPYSMFFSGGQAVHYSADFAARGYSGASHGCVNVRNWSGIQWLFGQVRVGDKVIVYS